MQRYFYDTYVSLLCPDGFPEFLNKYLKAPSMVRLKDIGYFCGMDYASKHIYQFQEKLSRFDHSLSVALLTWKFTGDKKATLAGLFHDIATPCFSHVIDYMNHDYEKQESTEEYTEEIIRNDKALQKCLLEDGISCEDVIDFKKYSIVDMERPKLCADRLDGLLLTVYHWIKTMTVEDMVEIVSCIHVYENEEHEKELGFESKDIALKVLAFNQQMDHYCHTSEDNYMMELLAKITRIAIEKKVITYQELFYMGEASLFSRMKNSKVSELEALLNQFETITKEEIPLTQIKEIKARALDPLVNGVRLSEMLKNEGNYH